MAISDIRVDFVAGDIILEDVVDSSAFIQSLIFSIVNRRGSISESPGIGSNIHTVLKDVGSLQSIIYAIVENAWSEFIETGEVIDFNVFNTEFISQSESEYLILNGEDISLIPSEELDKRRRYLQFQIKANTIMGNLPIINIIS